MVVKLRNLVSCVSGREFLKIVFECAHIRKSALYEQRGLFLVAVTLKNRFLYSFCDWFVKMRFFVSFVNGRKTLNTSFFVWSYM